MTEQENPKRRRRARAEEVNGSEPQSPATRPVETMVDVTDAPASADVLPATLDAATVQLVDESAATHESAEPALTETPIEVKNLDQPATPAQARIDSLLEALEAEIRSMPAADEERQGAIAEVIHLIRASITRWPKKVLEGVVSTLRANIKSDYLDADFWKGIALVLRYQLDANVDMLRRRWNGDYAVDEFGLDYELVQLTIPLLTFLYRKYWRVEARGLEHVPDDQRALLVCNHSGVLPWDGAMVGAALYFDHPAGRILRNLHLSWFSSLPFVAPLLSRLGQVQALPANAERLLERDELVGVFPEGLKGVGKLFRDRYKLARFGRGGFVKVAVKTGAPIIPVAIVGGEEIHPNLYNVKPVAKLLGFPYFPITPTFPILGPLGLIPLPSKWYITFCEPIETAHLGSERAEDPLLISQLTEQVRSTIQSTILEVLKERPGVFVG